MIFSQLKTVKNIFQFSFVKFNSIFSVKTLGLNTEMF